MHGCAGLLIWCEQRKKQQWRPTDPHSNHRRWVWSIQRRKLDFIPFSLSSLLSSPHPTLLSLSPSLLSRLPLPPSLPWRSSSAAPCLCSSLHLQGGHHSQEQWWTDSSLSSSKAWRGEAGRGRHLLLTHTPHRATCLCFCCWLELKVLCLWLDGCNTSWWCM